MSRTRTIRVAITDQGRLVFIACALGAAMLPMLGGLTLALRVLLPLGLLLLGSWRLGLRNLRDVGAAMPGPLTDFEFHDAPVRLTLHRGVRGCSHDLLVHHGGGAARSPFLYLASLRHGHAAVRDVPLRLPARGLQESHPLRVLSTWPLGLMRFELTLELPTEVLALPRLGSLRNTDAMLPRAGATDHPDPRMRSGSEEFYALREWREGMSQRMVHWKASARAGRLMLREMRAHGKPLVHLLLAPPTPVAGGLGNTAVRERRRRMAWEESIRLTGTLVEHLLREEHPVALIWTGRDPWTMRLPSGRRGLFQALGRVAVLPREPETVPPIPPAASPATVRLCVQAGGGHRVQPGRTRLDPAHPASAAYFRLERTLAPRTRMEVSA